MKKLVFILFIVFSAALNAQKVTVIDEQNLKPIENVYISSGKTFVLTDENGTADISGFVGDSILIFKHTSYTDLYLTFNEIKKMNYKVKLIESALDLNEVVVSASSWEQNKNEVSNRIKVISKNTIDNTNFQTSADLLKASGEVFIQKSQLGGGSPMIRGYAANRILLVVDGVRMNNAIFRSGNLQNIISADAHSIENSEIILGPGSVIYGSDAVGGVVDLHTLKPEISVSGKFNFKANSVFEFSSADFEKTGHLDFNFGTNQFASLTSVSFSDYDDLKMGSKGGYDEYLRKEYVETIGGIDVVEKNNNPLIQRFSGYSQLNLLQKFLYKPNKNLSLNYGFYYSKSSDVPRYDRLFQYNDDHLKYAEWYYGPQIWQMHNFKLNYSEKTKLFDNFKFTAAFQDYKESRHDRKFQQDDIRERFENVKAVSLNIDFEKHLSDKTSFYYGNENVYNKIFSVGQKRNIQSGDITPYASRYPDNSNYSSYALYASVKHNLSEKLTFNSGIRLNKIFADAVPDTAFYDFPFSGISLNTQAINGSAGLSYRPQTWLVKLNFGTGFRAPNIDDMAKVFDSEPGNVIVPNDKLKPEYIYNFDAAVSKTFFNKVQIDIAGYYSYLNNALVRGDYTFNGQDSLMYDGELSKVQAVINADYATVYGFNITMNADIFKNLSFKSTYNYSKGLDSFNKPVRHVPPAFGALHLIFKTEKFRADVFSEYNSEIPYENLADSERDKAFMYAVDDNGNPFSPAWITLNLNLSYQINKTFRLRGGIENIFDKQYRPYSSGIVASGRNFFFSLAASF